ncbi:hypothetical protein YASMINEVIRUS_473 [Yasminevirus sp. GU-2018]|uniref:Uncharacterized protein n=1 Tax=Yasminevirus sp. GU-2018 TaxID=2420051 RepID=A0A5K0U876_9VIRU|nr:hypothetical protein YASMINEVIRUS_473 [Yasminevirus sp. GU-2018]
MSYYFENKSRYQIIFPFTSDKIHVESDLDHGVFSCYEELKERGVKTPVFMVHDIDAGAMYELEIPKYKHLDVKGNVIDEPYNNTLRGDARRAAQNDQSMNQSGNQSGIFSTNGVNVNGVNKMYDANNQQQLSKGTVAIPSSNFSGSVNQINHVNPVLPDHLPMNAQLNTQPSQIPTQSQNLQQGIPQNSLYPPVQSVQIVQPNPSTDYDRVRQNEIITRLNHVEYQLDALKRIVKQKPKKEEEGCTIM